MVSTLVLMRFGMPPLGHSIKTNFIAFQIFDLQIHSLLTFYKKGVRLD